MVICCQPVAVFTSVIKAPRKYAKMRQRCKYVVVTVRMRISRLAMRKEQSGGRAVTLLPEQQVRLSPTGGCCFVVCGRHTEGR